jgi:orotate phosphoribosyltransferase
VTTIVECARRGEALALLEKSQALLHGHFLLSSGLHSPEYFQCARVLEWPAAAEQIARALAEVVRQWQPQVVLTPAVGGILIGYELARQLGVRNIFAERPSGAFELRRGFELAPGERVVLAENVITTGASVLEVADVARQHGAQVIGFATIVDRSGGAFAPDLPVATYLRTTAVTYSPEECPLCRQGLPLVKPGSRKITG